MTSRGNIAAGLLSIAATLVVIPATAAIVRDSIQERQTIGVLRAPKTFKISGSRILHPTTYHNRGWQSADESERRLQLVTAVASRTQLTALLRVWESVRAEALIESTEMSIHVIGVGEEGRLDSLPAEITVNHVTNAEQFSTMSGIRVLPFSLVMMRGGNVLAAGPGLPDVTFIREAAERFIREGPSAPTRFRLVTPQINSGLASIETLLSFSGTR